MAKRKFSGLLAALGLAAQFANGQLEPECNPLHTNCPAKKAWPHDNYFIDFTKETGPPENWIIANNEVVSFTTKGAEFTYGKKGDAPNMWTDFYMLGGRYDVEMQIAPGQGVISSSVLWSDIQDEFDWEFSGNQFGGKPFPPPDGMWNVETNIFTQGKMWDGAATYQKDSYNPTTQFHTYSLEWDETHVNWYIDNKVVRSVQASQTPSGFTFPQSPVKLQLGVWGGGDPENSYWTIKWAGGEIDMTGVPYTMYVRSVNITNKYPACQYKYKDTSGKISSIDKIQDGCNSASASATSPKIARENPPSETVGAEEYSTSPEPTGDDSVTPPDSSPSTSPDGYVVSSDSTPVSLSVTSTASEAAPTSLPSSSDLPPLSTSEVPPSESTPLDGDGAYPVASPSSPDSYPVDSTSSPYLYPVDSTSSPDSYPVDSTSVPDSYPVDSTPSPDSSSTAPTTGLSSYPVDSTPSSGNSPAVSTSSPYFYPVGPTASFNTYPVASMSSPNSSSTASTTGLSSYPVASISSDSSPVSSASSSYFYPVGSTSSSDNSPVASTSIPDSYPVASPSSPDGYPVDSTSTPDSYPTTATSNSNTYPIASTSSTGGLLSSLSSFIMGTSLRSYSSAPPVTVSDSTLSTSPAVSPSGPSSASSALSSSSSGTSQQNSSIATGSTTLSSAGAETGSASHYPTDSGSLTPTTSSIAMPSTYTFSSEITTSVLSTVYSTNIATITSCAPTVTNCPVGQITTETVSLYTTVCPVTNTIIDGTTYSGKPSISPIPGSSFSSSMPLVSNESPTTSATASAGFSSSISMSSVIYGNTTTPNSGLSTETQSVPSSYGQASSATVELTTSTVYSTNIYTITSCAPTVTNCPARLGQVTTELVSLYTTICPVTASASGSSAIPVTTSDSYITSQPLTTPLSSSTSVAPVLTTSTVYTSSVYTISSCAVGDIDCSSNIGSVTTELTPLYTTVCPVEDAPTALTTSAGPAASETATQPVSSVTSGVSSTVTDSVPLSSTTAAPVYTTSTVYSTNVYTVTSCAPDVTDCPARLGAVTTEIIAVSTTVCPVTDNSAPTYISSAPQANPSDYITTEVTISNTIGDSLILYTSIITFIDTPAPSSPTTTNSIAYASGTAAVPGISPSPTLPCTTLTLGNHFTTVITYASITQAAPDSRSPGSLTVTSYYTPSSNPNVDVPSYTMNPPSADISTAHETLSMVPGQHDGAGQCVCPPPTSTVYNTVTVTVAQTKITSTQTVDPPFPSISGTGSYPVLSGTGASGQPSSSSAMPKSTGFAQRRWFRRPKPNHGHGHGHVQGHGNH